MIHIARLRAALLSFAACFVATPLFAVTVVPGAATYEISFLQSGLGSQIYRTAGSYAWDGVLTASGFGNPVPIVTATGASSSNSSLPAYSINATSRLFYEYALNGPVDNVVVPLFALIALHAAETGPVSAANFAAASVGIATSTGGGDAEFLNTDSVGYAGPDLVTTLAFTQLSGSLGYVTLQASASAVGGGTAEAWADPLIYIDPEFLAANPGYTLTLSPGVVNAVPAPATLGLLATGLAGIVLRSRRRGKAT